MPRHFIITFSILQAARVTFIRKIIARRYARRVDNTDEYLYSIWAATVLKDISASRAHRTRLDLVYFPAVSRLLVAPLIRQFPLLLFTGGVQEDFRVDLCFSAIATRRRRHRYRYYASMPATPLPRARRAKDAALTPPKRRARRFFILSRISIAPLAAHI